MTFTFANVISIAELSVILGIVFYGGKIVRTVEQVVTDIAGINRKLDEHDSLLARHGELIAETAAHLEEVTSTVHRLADRLA